MIETLNNMIGEKTIYYKNRAFPPDKLDLMVYRIYSGYLNTKNNEQLAGFDRYYEQIRCWYYALLRLKQDEIGEEYDKEASQCFLDFYEVFQEVTKDCSKEEQLEILYRYPWHARIMLIAYQTSTKENIEGFIHGVASFNEIEEMSFGNISYLAITRFDEHAIDTIYDDIKEGHLEMMLHQIKQNLHTVFHSLEYLKKFLEKVENDEIKKEDRHAYNIFAYILKKHHDLTNAGKIDCEQYEFVLHTYASLCFWLFEADHIQPTWYVKQGKFRHLKEIRKKLLGFG